MRITLDTNVYISAFVFGGQAQQLLHVAIDRNIEIAVSEPILREFLRVLREEFDWDAHRLNRARQQILGFAQLVNPTQTLNVIRQDEPDNRILECAVESNSDFILTFDKDLLRLGEYGRIQIVRTVDFLQHLSR